MIDMHYHLLPGVDDGSQSWEMTMELARLSAAEGTTAIVCTPHMNADVDPLSMLERHAALREELSQRLAAEGIALELIAGAEWMLSADLLDVVLQKGRIGRTKAFLFELSQFMPIEAATDFAAAAISEGLQPILAHPERYRCLEPRTCAAKVARLASMGCVLQLTCASLAGDFGSVPKKNAEAIARAYPNAIVLGSDAHRPATRPPRMRAGCEALDGISKGLAAKALAKLETVLKGY